MINLLAAINVNQVEIFLDNFRFDADGNRLATDFDPYQTNPDTPAIDVYDTRDCYVTPEFQGYWKERSVGPNNFQLVNILVADKTEPDWTDPADPFPKTILTVVHYLRESFSGGLKVLDVFKRDGIRHGQTLVPAVLDENGQVVTPEQIIGQPTYPPVGKTEMLDYMPDDVVYDDDGNEISRTPATEYKEVHNVLGYSSRRYE